MSEAQTDTLTVAVLGIGKLGAGMARQVLAHGHEVRAWNRSPEKAEPLADDGATVVGDVVEAVRGADVVLTVLHDADSVVSVLEEAGPGLAGETVVVQSTTVGLDLDAVAAVAERLGVRLLDAPVLGTRKPAEDGTLVVLASGDPAVRALADPVLDAVGSKTVWAGDRLGDASRLKLVCNAWVATLTAGVAQSVAMAEGLGLDPQLFLQAIDGSPTGAPYASIKGGAMIDGDTAVSFSVDSLRKDLGLILEAAGGSGVDVRLVDAVRALFDATSEAGRGSADIAAVRSAF